MLEAAASVQVFFIRETRDLVLNFSLSLWRALYIIISRNVCVAALVIITTCCVFVLGNTSVNLWFLAAGVSGDNSGFIELDIYLQSINTTPSSLWLLCVLPSHPYCSICKKEVILTTHWNVWDCLKAVEIALMKDDYIEDNSLVVYSLACVSAIAPLSLQKYSAHTLVTKVVA